VGLLHFTLSVLPLFGRTGKCERLALSREDVVGMEDEVDDGMYTTETLGAVVM
jgi:hypothetical protein